MSVSSPTRRELARRRASHLDARSHEYDSVSPLGWYAVSSVYGGFNPLVFLRAGRRPGPARARARSRAPPPHEARLGASSSRYAHMATHAVHARRTLALGGSARSASAAAAPAGARAPAASREGRELRGPPWCLDLSGFGTQERHPFNTHNALPLAKMTQSSAARPQRV